jgi:hypothetical protein
MFWLVFRLVRCYVLASFQACFTCANEVYAALFYLHKRITAVPGFRPICGYSMWSFLLFLFFVLVVASRLYILVKLGCNSLVLSSSLMIGRVTAVFQKKRISTLINGCAN